MNILSVDLGSYSVKFLEAFVEKKKTTVLNTSEVIIKDYLAENSDVTGSLSEVQLHIVKDYVNKIEQGVRIVFQAPFDLITSRFINIPVKNKKKAELMLPFQLEEDIPFSLADTHFAHNLTVRKDHTEAAIAIILKESFDDYFQSIKSAKVMPHLLTYEASIYADFIEKESISIPTCVLDIGHSLTKAYFFNDGKLVAVNSSYISGQAINEAIIKSYQITLAEAIEYKHKNCFLLTKGQYSDVNESQKEFALLMHDVFINLINQIKRWEIGYRISYGNKISNILITGGSSNIKNISNYLAQYLDVRVQKLDSFVKTANDGIEAKNKSNFNLANIMANGSRGKSQFINFLTGNYAQISKDDLPLHSMVFTGVRVGFVMALMMLFLGIEYFRLNSQVKKMDIRIGKNFLQNPTLELTPRDRRNYRSKPDTVFKKLKRKRKFIEQEIDTIQAASKINAAYPLLQLSNIAGGYPKVELLSIESDEAGFVKATFTGNDIKDLRTVEAIIGKSDFTNILTDLNELKKMLRVEFNFK